MSGIGGLGKSLGAKVNAVPEAHLGDVARRTRNGVVRARHYLDPIVPKPSVVILVSNSNETRQVADDCKRIAGELSLAIYAQWGLVAKLAPARFRERDGSKHFHPMNILITCAGRLMDLCSSSDIDLAYMRLMVTDGLQLLMPGSIQEIASGTGDSREHAMRVWVHMRQQAQFKVPLRFLLVSTEFDNATKDVMLETLVKRLGWNCPVDIHFTGSAEEAVDVDKVFVDIRSPNAATSEGHEAQLQDLQERVARFHNITVQDFKPKHLRQVALLHIACAELEAHEAAITNGRTLPPFPSWSSSAPRLTPRSSTSYS